MRKRKTLVISCANCCTQSSSRIPLPEATFSEKKSHCRSIWKVCASLCSISAPEPTWEPRVCRPEFLSIWRNANTYAQSTDCAGNKKSLKSVVLSSKCAILAVQSQMSDSRLSGSFAFGNSFEDLRPSFPAVTESRPHGSFLNS